MLVDKKQTWELLIRYSKSWFTIRSSVVVILQKATQIFRFVFRVCAWFMSEQLSLFSLWCTLQGKHSDRVSSTFLRSSMCLPAGRCFHRGARPEEKWAPTWSPLKNIKNTLYRNSLPEACGNFIQNLFLLTTRAPFRQCFTSVNSSHYWYIPYSVSIITLNTT